MNSVFVADEKALLALAKSMVKLLLPGMVLYLHGNLGAGKTTLVRGLLYALGYKGLVKSPTYTLVEPYELTLGPTYHFDLYRLSDPEELEYMGIRDYFTPQSLSFVEWPEQGRGVLPEADIHCYLDYENKGRRVTLHSDNKKLQQKINELYKSKITPE